MWIILLCGLCGKNIYTFIHLFISTRLKLFRVFRVFRGSKIEEIAKIKEMIFSRGESGSGDAAPPGTAAKRRMTKRHDPHELLFTLYFSEISLYSLADSPVLSKHFSCTPSRVSLYS